MTDLDQALQVAHDAGDKHALVTLYTRAADRSECSDAQAFFLTQAYVFALETGSRTVPTLKTRLTQLGRETP